jgi:hypothetical protein
MLSSPDRSKVPPGFHFSQGSLQDFVDCPRRFQLRYIQQRAWPASISEPALEHERRVLQGAIFHRFVQQHLAGISAGRIQEMMDEPAFAAANPDLSAWWQNYRSADPAGINDPSLACRRYVEAPLSIPLGQFRLIARYDLLQIYPQEGETAGRAVILDWKTSRRKDRRQNLLRSLQTRVYRYVLVLAGQSLFPAGLPAAVAGSRLKPEQVEMVYWFAGFPDEPERIPYSPDQYEDDDSTLRSLISDITSRTEHDFPMTLAEKRCLYCVYRSLCERGLAAGAFDDMEENDGTDPAEAGDIDLTHIEEIAF